MPAFPEWHRGAVFLRGVFLADQLTIHLPVMQRYDCHACGYCCRHLVVNVTRAERRAIVDAGWANRITDQPLFVSYRFHGRRLIRLAHRPDGRCVFLGDDERCRLHAETGLGTKPLACRLYPFVPTPGPRCVAIDVRSDCPSVAANKGRPLPMHRGAVAELVRELSIPWSVSCPRWPGVGALRETEYRALAAAFGRILDARTRPHRARLEEGCRLLDLLYGARFESVRGERFVELLGMLSDAVREEEWASHENAAKGQEVSPRPLSGREGRLFRQWLFLHALADDPETLRAGPVRKLQRSWQRYMQSRRFAAGVGVVPILRPDWPRTTFEAVNAVAPAPDAGLEPLVRSMRVKLDAFAFAGPAYFGADVLGGLTALWMLPGVVGFLARLRAVSGSRTVLDGEDVLAGVREAHHTFGVSPVFARISERLRLRALARPGVAGAVLQAWAP